MIPLQCAACSEEFCHAASLRCKTACREQTHRLLEEGGELGTAPHGYASVISWFSKWIAEHQFDLSLREDVWQDWYCVSAGIKILDEYFDDPRRDINAKLSTTNQLMDFTHRDDDSSVLDCFPNHDWSEAQTQIVALSAQVIRAGCRRNPRTRQVMGELLIIQEMAKHATSLPELIERKQQEGALTAEFLLSLIDPRAVPSGGAAQLEQFSLALTSLASMANVFDTLRDLEDDREFLPRNFEATKPQILCGYLDCVRQARALRILLNRDVLRAIFGGSAQLAGFLQFLQGGHQWRVQLRSDGDT